MEKRTIIMLSAKRSGSSAVFKIFQKHPDVGVCHIDQNIHYWEPNFWNLAARAVEGDKKPFADRFEKSHPFLEIPEIFDEKAAFDLWERILDELGPIVFDKSPQYLGNYKATDLLKRYIKSGADVRIFGVIRDPKDAITSQYELWSSKVENDSPKRREKKWLEQYRHLEELQEELGYFPVFRYEDFSRSPAVYARQLLLYCGLKDIPETYAHIKPINVGRYARSLNKDIRKWEFGEDFIEANKRYGYGTESADERISLKEYFAYFREKIKNKISPYKVN